MSLLVRGMVVTFSFTFVLSGALPLWAQETKEPVKKAQTPAPSRQSNVLDFDADVIEGERSGPNLLVQLDLQAPGLDTLVFQRKNFNDFHVIDMKRKPKFRGRSTK